MALRLGNLTFDCDDPGVLAGFWSEVMGDWRVVTDPNPFMAMLRAADDDGDGVAMLFIKVPERKAAKNRCHPDLRLAGPDAIAAEVDRILGLGATHVHTREEFGVRWATFTDPEGNEFCVGAEVGDKT